MMMLNATPVQQTAPVVTVTSSRVISGVAFLALWQPPEIAAAIAADPQLLAAAFKVLTQNSANLDSSECAAMLALAVSKGAITQDRANQIAANTPPT